jgi:acyl-CoA synthetase (AMP-forming)/AMP-acid ligase II
MVDYGYEEVEKSLTERFEKQVVKYGGRVAIRALTRSLSYNELNALANRVARAILQNLGEGERGVCAFLVEHSEAQEKERCRTIEPFFISSNAFQIFGRSIFRIKSYTLSRAVLARP